MSTTDAEAELAACYRKVYWRILPVCLAAYVVSFIDRSNIGMAKLQFLADLHFNEAIYGLGAGLFFIGYMIFEIPINIFIERKGARRVLALIMIVWGLISSLFATVKTPETFYALRFLLGVAEAGLFPGVILYLSYWFPKQRRGRTTAIFAMGGPLAGVIGSPLSGWLMASLTGTFGLLGWQNLFIFEGLPAIALGVFVFFYLDDRPGAVRWLTPRENGLVQRQVQGDGQAGSHAHEGFARALRDARIYVAMLVWTGVIAGVTVVSLWTPTLLGQHLGGNIRLIGWLSALPSACAVLVMFLVARSSDRLLERRWHFASSLLLTALSLASLVLLPVSLPVTLVLLSTAAAGLWAATAVFWTVPSTYLRGDAAAAGIALISSAGGVGGFLAPTLMGWLATLTGTYATGVVVVATFLAALAVVFVIGSPVSRLPGQRPGRSPVVTEARSRNGSGR